MIKKKNRLSNFELLRIVSIIMIIAHHYSVHGGWLNKINGISANNLLIDFLAIGGKIGVSCFVLITGYFGIQSKFNFKKIIKLIIQILFYSIGIYFVFNILNFDKIEFNIANTIKSFFPITFSLYWFMTSYILLYIFSPFINNLITNLKTREFLKLIIVLIIISYIIPTLTTSNFQLSELIVFITLYLIGGFIKLHEDGIIISKQKTILYFVISYILIFITQIILEIVASKYIIVADIINYFAGLDKITVLICSTSLFMYFKNLKIQNNIINKIAETSLGIYLIHDNIFMRTFLWEIIFNNNKYYSSNFLIFHSLIAIITVYIFCLSIELLRIAIENKILPHTYNIYDIIKKKIKGTKIYDIYRKINET